MGPMSEKRTVYEPGLVDGRGRERKLHSKVSSLEEKIESLEATAAQQEARDRTLRTAAYAATGTGGSRSQLEKVCLEVMRAKAPKVLWPVHDAAGRR